MEYKEIINAFGEIMEQKLPEIEAKQKTILFRIDELNSLVKQNSSILARVQQIAPADLANILGELKALSSDAAEQIRSIYDTLFVIDEATMRWQVIEEFVTTLSKTYNIAVPPKYSAMIGAAQNPVQHDESSIPAEAEPAQHDGASIPAEAEQGQHDERIQMTKYDFEQLGMPQLTSDSTAQLYSEQGGE